MESSILQLFTLEEILERIGKKMLTGSLHIFNSKDSANLFFRDGVVVATAKGLIEGEDALKQTLDLKETRYAWQSGVLPPMPPYKPIQVNVLDFLVRFRAKPADLSRGTIPINGNGNGANGHEAENGEASGPPIAPPVPTLTRSSGPVPVAASGASLSAAAVATTPLFTSRTMATSPVQLSPTRSLASSGTVRMAQEDALLKKHKFTLVAADNPAQRIKVTRVSSLIGRNPACDIMLDHGSISRQHCLVQINDRGLHVKDLGTTNGTKVNGISMMEGYVNPGDKLTMGHLGFLVEKE